MENDALNRLYSKSGTICEFNYDSLVAPPLLMLLSVDDIAYLNRLATSIKLSSKPKEKYALIEEVMKFKGFRRLNAGTNRLVYRHLEFPSIVCKVAIDKVGIYDNPAEYRNQFSLRPFCTKVFEVSPCGTVGLFERVVPIMHIEEYYAMADDIFNMLYKKILGKYVMADIGSKFFKNIGIRANYGPVLLDFPYLYELDGDKLYCNNVLENGHLCNGSIDYDDGFNFLKCNTCGKEYKARDLEKIGTEDSGICIEKGRINMKVEARLNGKVINTVNETVGTRSMSKKAILPEMKAQKQQTEYTMPVVSYKGFNGKASVINSKPAIILNESEPKFEVQIKGFKPEAPLSKIEEEFIKVQSIVSSGTSDASEEMDQVDDTLEKVADVKIVSGEGAPESTDIETSGYVEPISDETVDGEEGEDIVQAITDIFAEVAKTLNTPKELLEEVFDTEHSRAIIDEDDVPSIISKYDVSDEEEDISDAYVDPGFSPNISFYTTSPLMEKEKYVAEESESTELQDSDITEEDLAIVHELKNMNNDVQEEKSLDKEEDEAVINSEDFSETDTSDTDVDDDERKDHKRSARYDKNFYNSSVVG